MGNSRTKSCEVEGVLIKSGRRSELNKGPDETQFPFTDLKVGESFKWQVGLKTGPRETTMIHPQPWRCWVWLAFSVKS